MWIALYIVKVDFFKFSEQLDRLTIYHVVSVVMKRMLSLLEDKVRNLSDAKGLGVKEKMMLHILSKVAHEMIS